jgi:hypothetical protein
MNATSRSGLLLLVGLWWLWMALDEQPPPPDPWGEALEKAVIDHNRRLPQMIDPVTRLDRVDVEGASRIHFRYTLLRYPTFPVGERDWREGMRKRIIERSCHDKALRRVIDHGLRYYFHYHAADGHLIGSFVVDAMMCSMEGDGRERETWFVKGTRDGSAGIFNG